MPMHWWRELGIQITPYSISVAVACGSIMQPVWQVVTLYALEVLTREDCGLSNPLPLQ
ncbi:hypothetical protein [Clostridium aceticum]|nr:hypothetical protein [Clostridium aceticum]